MAKEFDIHLNNRTTEYDILIYSLPFRDNISIENQFVLSSNVDKITKVISERIDNTVVIGNIEKRFRLLYEMDHDNLDVYDELTLNGVDYVILRG